jgi:diguanylate cyclase (GGDEF)-like protein
MQTQLGKFGKGQRARTQVSNCSGISSRASVLTMKLGSRPALSEEVSQRKPGRENEVAEVVFQALLTDAREELKKLLRDVRAKQQRRFPGETPGRRSSDLLERAVRCAAKHYRLQTELGNLAFTDELTGLYNRRAFQALAERQLKLGNRAGRGMLVFFIDLDGLNRINDSFGHAEGDQALKRTAEILKRTFRDSDVIARHGGDEFAVLAVEADGHSEATMMRRLNKCINAVNSEHREYAISLSVGVARFDHRKPVSIADLMVEADQAMYAQKRSRPRSRVAVGGGSQC